MLHDEHRIAEWYTEIVNTYPELIYDENMAPTGFRLKHTLPFDQINMKLKRPKAPECQEYLKIV